MCAIEGALIRCSGHRRSGVCQRIVEHHRRFEHFVRPITRPDTGLAEANGMLSLLFANTLGSTAGSYDKSRAFMLCLSVERKRTIPPSWKQCLVASMRRIRPSLLGSSPDCFASSSIGSPSGFPRSLSVILALVTTWSATGSSYCVRNFSFEGYVSDYFRSRDDTHTVGFLRSGLATAKLS